MKFATITETLRWRSQTNPTGRAFTFLADGEVDRAVHMSYGELDERARRIANFLRQSVPEGQARHPVILVFPPGLGVIEAIFGCFYAGLPAVVADFPRRRSSVAMLEAIIEDSQAQIALTSGMADIKTPLAQSETLQKLQWLALDEIPAGTPCHDDGQSCAPDAIALLQYTSGSTGAPRGVMVSHANIVYNSACIKECFRQDENSRIVIWLPPSHDMGLVGGIFQPLYSGYIGILMPPLAFIQRPVRWLNAISSFRATTSTAPNFAYDLCVRKVTSEQRDSLDLSSWTVAINGAEPVLAGTIEVFADYFAASGFRREAFCPSYGLAEATLVVSGEKRQTPPVRRYVSDNASTAEHPVVGCGKPLDTQKLVIVDPQLCVPQPPNKVGEIWIAGGSVTSGYWNRPEETEATFGAWLADSGEGPFLRTGDLGCLVDGELFITGRSKDLIIIRGANYSPYAIEQSVANCHPALQPAGGVAITIQAEGGEQLAIIHELERSFIRTLPEKEVIEAIRHAVAEEQGLEVHSIALLKTASLPRTPTGKPKRYACREGFLNGTLNAIFHWSANHQDGEPQRQGTPAKTTASPVASSHQREIRAWLLRKLAQQLNVPEADIDVRRPFADYGFDSARVVEFAGDLEDHLGCELSPTCVYDYPTVESLCAYLAVASSRAKAASHAAVR